MDADHHVSCDKELRWNVNVEPLFVQDQGVDTGSRKTGRKYKSCFERGNAVDAQSFVDFYTSKGWYVGKTKMKDWKASVRTWEKNQRQKNKKSKDDEGLEGWLNA